MGEYQPHDEVDVDVDADVDVDIDIDVDVLKISAPNDPWSPKNDDNENPQLRQIDHGRY